MPITSRAQLRYFAAKHPDLLKKWQAEAPVKYADLPEKKKSEPYRKVKDYLR
jgi:hypothetical protein